MPRRIVILSAFVTPFRSGAEACAEEVSARLKDEFDITIVTARMRKDLPYLDHLPLSPGPFPPGGERGVRVWRIGIGHSIDKWLYPFLAPFVVKTLKPDIIHAVLETFAGLALKWCRVKGAKKILTLQTTNRSFLKGPIIRSADTVTAISSVLVQQAKKEGKDAVLIPNGIRLDLIDEALKRRPKIDGRILFVGRLEAMKGVDVLLTAFAKLKDGRYKMEDERENEKSVFLTSSVLHLRIVGDGSQRSMLEKLCHDLGLHDRVTFVGRVNPQQVAEEMAQASVFCGLSRSEALGNVFLEAQAAGCAVIGTNVGGIPDSVKDMETGLLVPADNAEAAAAAMKRLLENDILRQQLVSRGQEQARNYDWGVIAARYKGLYEDD